MTIDFSMFTQVLFKSQRAFGYKRCGFHTVEPFYTQTRRHRLEKAFGWKIGCQSKSGSDNCRIVSINGSQCEPF